MRFSKSIMGEVFLIGKTNDSFTLARLFKRLGVGGYHIAALVHPPRWLKEDVCKSPNLLPSLLYDHSRDFNGK
jgi:hypothetical protein